MASADKHHDDPDNNENHIGRKIVLTSRTIHQAFDLELGDKVSITMAWTEAIISNNSSLLLIYLPNKLWEPFMKLR
jgi:hypothetical protein